MKEYLLRMTNDGIFVGGGRSIPLSNTNLPVNGFAFNEGIKWLVGIKEKDIEKIHVRVLEYNPSENYLFELQTFPLDVMYILFDPFDYNELITQISVTETGIMRRLCFDHPRGAKNLIGPDIILGNTSQYSSDKIAERDRQLKIWNERNDPGGENSQNVEDVRVKYTDAKIEDGGITFDHMINKIIHRIKIDNKNLRNEYELIKDYIIKRGGKKSFNVQIVYLRVPEFRIIKANSRDIDAIDSEYIDTIRTLQIKSLIKAEVAGSINKLLTLNDTFALSDIVAGNLFNVQLEDIIKVLTNDYDYRNSQELVYLSQIHDATAEKVYLSLQPYFGFIFFCQSDYHNFYVWELLDTHATYVWSYSKEVFDIVQSFKQMEIEISSVHAMGRNGYKVQMKDTVERYAFHVVEHNEIEENPSGAFLKWKQKISTILES